MNTLRPIQGELQSQLMPTLWRLRGGTVEEVRAALPKHYQSAATTAQTVLNRPAQRSLLGRERTGQTIVYSPRISYLAIWEILDHGADRAD